MELKYLLGFGATKSELSIESLEVHGQVPDWLAGTLIRNGPGTFQVGEQAYRHWFDGLAMLHRFTITGGRVSYANKYLATKSYETARAQGRITYSEFATDPCRSLFARVMAVFDPHITDSAKVSIAKIAGKYTALAETPIQVMFDPQTLETAGVFQYEPRTVGQMTTVHPHFDGKDAYNLVTHYNALSHYNFYRVRESQTGSAVQKVASLPVTRPGYLHSFGMSQHYFVLAEFPLVVKPLDLLLWLRPYIENFHWEPQRGTRFWVFDRQTGKLVGQYESEAFFAFHHINAFERDGELVVDLAAYPDARIVQSYYLNRLRDECSQLPFGQFLRCRIPIGRTRKGTVQLEKKSDACMELPHFDYAGYNTNGEYRYIYAVSLQPGNRMGFYNRLIKLDIKTNQVLEWSAPDCYPGEPVFVRQPGSLLEDQGIILSVVLDTSAATSFLLVLDAQTFTEICRAVVPQPVLFGYHGAFFQDLRHGEKVNDDLL